MPDLVIENVSKQFGTTAAVHPLSLHIRDGELACLLGPSGSGKTTLLRMIGGFETPTSGRIIIGGKDFAQVPAEKRPTTMVFQSHALWSHMNVFANVAFGLKLRNVARAEIANRVEAMLDLVGLNGLEKRMPHQLSGGQQQRVAIARCLVVEPAILLMDEPFASLDQHLRERLREEVRQIQRKLGITTIFVTHGQEEALAIADSIIVMSTGAVEQVGTPTEIYDRPNSAFVAGFIGVMNMLEGNVREGMITAAGFDLPVNAPDGPATLAIRPEDFTIDPAAGLSCSVSRTVNLGPFLLVHLRSQVGAEIKVQLDKRSGIIEGAGLRLIPRRYTVFSRDGEHPVQVAATA